MATRGSASAPAAACAVAPSSRFGRTAGAGRDTLEHAAPRTMMPRSTAVRTRMTPSSCRSSCWLYIQPRFGDRGMRGTVDGCTPTFVVGKTASWGLPEQHPVQLVGAIAGAPTTIEFTDGTQR